MEPTFICDQCGGEFPDDVPIEQVDAERERNYPGVPAEACATVCDACYEKVR